MANISSQHKLNYSRRRLTDVNIDSLRRELPLKQTSLAYEEVDFSQNELSSSGLKVVLDVCRRCPKLKILKLYKNQIDDGGAAGLAELCKSCPAIEEMHLSHNHITATGVEVLVTAAEEARPSQIAPLWLRLEQNDVVEPEAVYSDLSSRLSVCNRTDEIRCTVRVCCRRMKIHLPFFHLQRRARDGPGPQVSPTASPTTSTVSPTVSLAPSRSIAPKSNGLPIKNGTGCAWNGTFSSARSPVSPTPPHSATAGGLKPSVMTCPAEDTDALPPAQGEAAGGAAAAGTAATGTAAACTISVNQISDATAEPEAANGKSTSAGYPKAQAVTATLPAADVAGDRSKVRESEQIVHAEQKLQEGVRCSVVLDAMGKRRIHPKQLEDEGASSSQFVCPLCNLVMIRPVITSCSHLFCDDCFKQWVADQVSKMTRSKPTEGPTPPVPLLPCPQPQCQQKLRKKDIVPMEQADTGGLGAVQLLKRMRNNLRFRCVHHTAHFTFHFGQDAERVEREQGITCKWIGDLGSYEEHQRKCPVEMHLEATQATTATCLATGTPASRSRREGEIPAPPAHVPVKAAPAQKAVWSGVARSNGVNSPAAETVAQPCQRQEKAGGEETGQVRVARYEYLPKDTEKAQITLRINDLVRIFEVSDSGWAAGVKLCRETGQEVGAAGWFPAGYVFPPEHVATA